MQSSRQLSNSKDILSKQLSLNRRLNRRMPRSQDFFREIDVESTVLEEFVFWLSRLHYPEVLNHFFLHLLPNDDYKLALTRSGLYFWIV